MRRIPPGLGAALSAIAIVLTAIALGASSAAAAVGGGASAPTVPLSGGSEYGVTSSASVLGPVVTSLSVPSTAPPGRPPRVTLRLDESHVGTVDVQVAIHNLTTRKAAIVVNLGWVHTGRTVTVSWPGGAMLPAGTYHLSISAHDHRGGNLNRSAHSSGVVTLTVAAPPPPAPVAPVTPAAPTAGAPAAPEAGVPTPAQTVADGAVFPVQGAHSYGNAENRYGAARSGHIHEGQDVLAAEGTEVVAPLGGTITSTAYQAGGAGYYAVEHTLVGFDFMFAHCMAASLAVSANQPVSAGQAICQAGQTGDATGPHLHFEMWVGGWQSPTGHSIDPLPYLEAWEHLAG